MQMTPDEKEEVLHRLKSGQTLEPLFRQRINQLVEELIDDDKYSEQQFRMLLLLSGASLTDLFVMDHDHEKATAVRSTKRKATQRDHKQALFDHVWGKHRVVKVEGEGGDGGDGGRTTKKMLGGAPAELDSELYEDMYKKRVFLLKVPPTGDMDDFKMDSNIPNTNTTYTEYLKDNPVCITIDPDNSSQYFVYLQNIADIQQDFTEIHTAITDIANESTVDLDIDDINDLLKGAVENIKITTPPLEANATNSNIATNSNNATANATANATNSNNATNAKATAKEVVHSLVDIFSKDGRRELLSFDNLQKLKENPTPLFVIAGAFLLLFRNSFIWRPLGFKYFGRNAKLHNELVRYYLERHTDALIRRGYTLDKLYDISDRRSKINRLMNKLHMQSSGRYGDERDRFVRMLRNEDLGDDDEYEDQDEYDDDDIHTRKNSTSHSSHRSRKSATPEFTLADILSQVATMTIRITVPVMLAFLVATSVMAKDKTFPTAFSHLGNSEFSRLYNNPSQYKTLSTRDVNHDDNACAYAGGLAGVDTRLHELFATQKNVDKLRYALLKLHQYRTNLSGRRVLPLHVMRTNGDVRGSANEMARAVKHHWEKRNLVGVYRSRAHATFHKMSRRRRKGGRHSVMRRTHKR